MTKTGNYRVVQLGHLPIFRVEVEYFRFLSLSQKKWKPLVRSYVTPHAEFYSTETLECDTLEEAKMLIRGLEARDYEYALREDRAWEPR